MVISLTTLRSLTVVACLILARQAIADESLNPASTTPADPVPAQVADRSGEAIDFGRDIRPILSNRCYKCHGPDTRQAGLALHERELAVGELASGERAVVGGNPQASELLRRVGHDDPDLRMPPPDEPGGPLTAEEVAKLRAWIAGGAPYSRHWAFVPPQRPAAPAVRRGDWPINGVDRFVLATLEREGLAPAPAAAPAVLLRRASLTLTGLPPTAGELDALAGDTAPGAYLRAVDRLLASPRYGEHQARWWLDLARYADTDGYEKDNRRVMWPYRDAVIAAFNADRRFDEFTREQLAGDLMADAAPDDPRATAWRIASGFHRNTMTNTEGGADDEEFRIAAVMDRVNTTGEVWLGLTLGCAACHNHKYDPTSQRDYYRLMGVWNSTADSGRRHEPILELPTPQQALRKAELARQVEVLKRTLATSTRPLEAAQAAWEQGLLAQTEAAKAARDKLPGPARAVLETPTEQRTAAQRLTLAQHFRDVCDELASVRRQLEATRREQTAHAATIPQTLVMRELASPRATHVLIGGSHANKGEVVEAGPIDWLTPGSPNSQCQPTKVRRFDRLALANWLTAPDHPLTARVLVNRIWATHFGRGLVETLEDFGNQGTMPSYPELLDWLAVEFVEQGWSLKAMHRLIVTSATFAQDSRVTPDTLARDPHNQLLSRGPRRRLDAEVLRDNALTIAGLLHHEIGGPSVFPHQPPGVWANPYSSDRWVVSDAPQRHRRGLYTFWRRTAPYAGFAVFDAPSREICTSRRGVSNTPLQALAALNDPVYVEAAVGLARRIMTESPSATNVPPSDRSATPGAASVENPVTAGITWAMRLATARAPHPDDVAVLAGLYQRSLATYRADPQAAQKLVAALPEVPANSGLAPDQLAAWAVVANVILNLDETLTLH